jgi:sodium-dependent phosphate cotransporter
VIGLLLLFLFSIDLLVSSLRTLGDVGERAIVSVTQDPFTALFVGLLLTALIQSSSTTTSLVVAVVASGFVSLQQAVFVIMGANLGTTFTSTVLAFTFVDKNRAFRRAVAAGTYHDFFNLLTILFMFPIEYRYGLLTRASTAATRLFTEGTHIAQPTDHLHLLPGFGALIDWITTTVSQPVVVALLAFALVFLSILFFRRMIARLLVNRSSDWIRRLFFQGTIHSFLLGLISTAAIRSSTVTTSLVVPMVAQRIIKLRMAASFIRGANIGTTVTAFIAASSGGSSEAISLATAHFLFNVSGSVVFSVIPWVNRWPLNMSLALGRLASRHQYVLFLYVLLTFFIAPFTVIFIAGGNETDRLRTAASECSSGVDAVHPQSTEISYIALRADRYVKGSDCKISQAGRVDEQPDPVP